MVENDQRKTGAIPGHGDGSGAIDGSGALDGERTGDGERPGPDLEDNELDSAREEPIGGDEDFDSNLDSFLSERNSEQLPARITLSRYKNPLGGENGARVQIDEWQNFIPSWHEIGIKHGSGRYIIQITIPKGRKQRKTNASRSKVLDVHYDILKQEALNRAYAGAVPAGKVQPIAPASQDQSLVIIERLMGLFAPIITAMLARQAAPASPGAEMVSMYGAMNQLFKRQAEENMNLLNGLTRDRLENGFEDDTDDPEIGDLDRQPAQPSFFQQAAPFISEALKMLLGGGPQGAAAGAIIKKVPGFKEVINNPGELKKFIAEMDRTIGTDKVNQALKKLKVARPK